MTFSSIFLYLKKNYVITVCSAVVVVCLGVFFVRNDQITRLAADYDDLSVRYSRILKNLKFASEIEGDLEQIRAMDEEVNSRLLNPEDLATNQRYFYQIESATGVSMTSIQQIVKPLPEGKKNKKARKKAEQSPYQELIYDMIVQGEYSELLAFLRKIEGGKRFAVLDGFSVVSANGNWTDNAMKMRLSVSVLGEKL